jgi:hypothetical protein
MARMRAYIHYELFMNARLLIFCVCTMTLLFGRGERNALFLIVQNSHYGFITRNGKIAIPPQFDGASQFSEGLAAVWVADKVGYIDESGKFLIKPQKLDFADSFYEGLAAAGLDNKLGYLDKSGQWAIPPKFQNALPSLAHFANGLAGVFKMDPKDPLWGGCWGYIDRKGNWAIEPRYESVGKFSEGLASVKINGKWGFIDQTGKIVIRPQFQEAFDFSEGLAPAKSIDKFGFINKKGEWVLAPRYDEAMSFSEHLSSVRVGNQWGYIDKNAYWTIKPFSAEAAWPFKNGLAAIWASTGRGYIDKSGRYMWRPSR